MQIIVKPSLYSFAGNCSDIIVSTTVSFAFKLTIGDNVINCTYSPNSSAKVTINIRKELELLCSSAKEIISGGISSTPLTMVKYKVGSLSEETFYCLNGGLSVAADAATFFKSNFLTWRPQTFKTTYHSPQSLAYVAMGSCVIKARGKIGIGFELITLATLSAGNIYNIDVTYGNLRSKFTALPSFIDIWVEGENVRSYTQRFVIVDSSDNDDIFQWVNSLGGIDTAIFTGDIEEIHNSESLVAALDDNILEYGIDLKKGFKKHTGYFDDDNARLWVLDFFNSSSRWHLFEGHHSRIVVTKPSLKSTRGELTGYEFEFAKAKQSRYLNLPRLADNELLEFESDNGDLFFLAPRLNGFAQANLEREILFPVQYPNLEGWFKLSLVDLLAKFKIGHHTHTIENVKGLPEELKKLTDDITAIPKPDLSGYALKVHTHSDYALKNGSLKEPFRVNSLEAALSGGGSAIVAYDLANPSYTPPTGGGTLDLHASTHGKGGVDPITPIMIGAAAEVHSHTGYANATHDHNAVYSLLNHNHNAAYSLLSHSHTDYSLTNHNHDSNYSAKAHTHSDYALKNGSLAEYFAVKTLRMSMGGSYAEVSYNANSSSYTPPTGGGDGTLDHSLLLNRDNSDQHTIAAITGLQSALNGKQPIGSYAAMTHDHNAVYSLLNHNHNAAYSLLSHSHTDYSLTNHNHDSVYTPIGHATNKSNPHGVTAGQIGAYKEYAGSIPLSNLYTFTNRPSGGYIVQYGGASGALHVLRSGGSTSAIELFMSDYIFGTRLKLRKTIDSNRYDGGFKELAWLSDLDNYALKNGSLAEYFAVKTLRMAMGGSYAEVSYNANSSSYTPPTGGGDGTLDHSLLLNRDNSDQHTIAAITGLQSALNGKQPIGSYAAMTHDHNAVYSLLNHNHNAVYSLLSHSHTAAQVGALPITGGTVTGATSFNTNGFGVGSNEWKMGLESSSTSNEGVVVLRNAAKTYISYLRFGLNKLQWHPVGNNATVYNLYHTGNLPTPSTAPTANTLVQRDVNGFVQATIFRDNYDTHNLAFDGICYRFNQDDGYHRFCTKDFFKEQLNLMTRSGIQSVADTYALKSPYGQVAILPLNTEYCHIHTDRPRFHFNKPVFVAGDVYGGAGYNRRLAYVDEATIALPITGQNNNALSYYQSDKAFEGSPSEWSSYIIMGHGSSSTYFSNMLRFPFYRYLGAPQYQRKVNGVNEGWKTFWTTENLDIDNYALKNGSLLNDFAVKNLTANGNIQYKQAVAALYNNAGVETGTITIKYIQ